MKMNRPFLLVFLSAASGLLIGVAIMSVIQKPPQSGKMYEDLLRLVTSEHSMHATLLRAGKSDEVLRMIESTFPSSVLYYNMFKFRGEGDVIQLWRIREYGERHHLIFPAAVASLLADLPPKPASVCAVNESQAKPNMK
jgi:hypothetical protein